MHIMHIMHIMHMVIMQLGCIDLQICLNHVGLTYLRYVAHMRVRVLQPVSDGPLPPGVSRYMELQALARQKKKEQKKREEEVGVEMACISCGG